MKRLIEKYLDWRIKREQRKVHNLQMQVTQEKFRFEMFKKNHKNS